ncbi:MAG: hypothetical protein DKT66_09760 [Candidatus Melainabacteria bacterium]|nr:MAG: hypothetical protein DKT66_09760 [Candidatus Melainabacteria bacterium]
MKPAKQEVLTRYVLKQTGTLFKFEALILRAVLSMKLGDAPTLAEHLKRFHAGCLLIYYRGYFFVS